MGGGRFFANLPPPPPLAPAFGIRMLPLPILFLLLFLLPGVVPPAAAQPALSLEPSGVLVRMGYIVPTGVYSDSPETDGLNRGVRDVVASGDLLFVTAFFDNTLSVWRVNAEAGTLSQTAIYQDNRNGIDGLNGAAGVAVSDDGQLLFVAGRGDDALSVWRVNEAAESLEQIEVYLDDGRDRVAGIDGLDDANDIAVSGNLLFVTGRNDDALSVWQVNAAAGTLRRTALYRDQNNLGTNIEQVAVSGNLLFVTASAGVGVLSVWQIDAEEGTLMQTGVYRREIADDPSTGPGGLAGAEGVAVSGDGNLLFVIGHATDHLSAWRVNAEEGTLMQTALYQNRAARMREGIPVDGLFFPRSVAVSGNLLFVAADQDGALSAWQINAEEGTLIQTGLFRSVNNDPNSESPRLTGAWNVAVSGNLLFVTVFDLFNLGIDQSLSVWHINHAEVSMERPTVISMQLDMPVDREVMVTVTAQSGAEMVRANPVTLSPTTLSARAVFPPGALGLGRWVFTAQANLPTVLDTGAAQTAVQVVPVLSLGSSQEQFAVGSAITLAVRASPAMQVTASYRIIARRIDLPSMPEADFTFTHPAGSTEVTVLIPGQSLSTGQWEFSIQLPNDSPFRAGDSVTAFISTPRTLILQPGGALRLEHVELTDLLIRTEENDIGIGSPDIVTVDGDLLFAADDFGVLGIWRVNAEAGTLRRTVVYTGTSMDDDGNQLSGLIGVNDVEVGGSNLLFVSSFTGSAISVFRLNRETGTLVQTAVYQDDAVLDIREGVVVDDTLFGVWGLEVSGNLLFAAVRNDDALSVWQVNESSGTLRRTAVYRNSDPGIGGLRRARFVTVSDDGKLLFVTSAESNALSVWRVNASSGTLQQTVVYQDGTGGIDGLGGALRVAGRGDLLFVTAQDDDALSTWRVNASSGTLTQIQLYRDGVRGIDGLGGAEDVAISGDGDLLFVTGGDDDALSVWRVNAEAGTLIQVDLHLDGERGIDGLDGADGIAVSGDLLFVAGSADNAVSAWRIKVVEVSLDMDTVLSVQSDMPILEDVVVTVTASNGAEMFAKTVSLSAGILSEEVIFPAGTLGPGRWIFTAQAEPPALLNTGAARIAVQVFPLLSLESRQEQFGAGSTVTLAVRASAALQVAASYHIIARRIGFPSVPEVDSAFTHPAGSTEVTVFFPGQSLSTGQWEFSIQLPGGSPFRVGDSVTAFISTPALSLQPEGMLSMMGHAVPTEVFNVTPSDLAISGDLLFVTESNSDALSVWQINEEAGTLSRAVVYRNRGEDDSRKIISGLNGAEGVAVSGNLLFVVGLIDSALSVWRVNRASGTLVQTAVYRNGDRDDGDKTISGLSQVEVATVSGNLLFVAGNRDRALSVWQVNESLGTLRQTAVYRNSDPGASERLSRVLDIAVSDDLLFAMASNTGVLSAWRINAEEGTLTPTDFHRDGVNGIDGLSRAESVAVSGDLLFVPSVFDNTLSVWRINARAGTLRQVELYRDGVNGIDGLDTALSVAVSGDLLFVTGRGDRSLSVWRINAEAQAGILRQTALHRDGVVPSPRQVEVSGNLLFLTSQAISALSVWHINNAEVPFGAPVMIRVQSDMPVLREVVVTITARNGAEEAEAAVTLSPDGRSAEAIFHLLSPGRWIFTAQAQPPALLNTGAAGIAMQVRAPVELTLDVPGDVTVGNTFTVTVGVAAGTPLPKSVSVTATLSLSAGDGAEIEVKEVVLTGEQSAVTVPFTVPSTVGRYTVAARGIRSDSILLPVIGTSAQVTVQPVPVFLESRQERFTAGNTVTLTVRVSAALRVAASYRIIARRIGPPSVPEVDFAFTHSAGSTEVTVFFPGQSLSTGQWEFSIQLPGGSPFRAGDSVTAFISTPQTLILQPGGALRLEHVELTDLLIQTEENDIGIVSPDIVTVDGDLLFAVDDFGILGIWRVNAEAGTLRRTAVYTATSMDDDGNQLSGLIGVNDVEVGGSNLLFVSSFTGSAISVLRLNRETGTLVQTAVYQDDAVLDIREGVVVDDTLFGVWGLEVSGNLLFAAVRNDDALSVWQVNESSGTLRRTAVYRNSDPGIGGLRRARFVTVSDDGKLLFVTSAESNALSVWRVNASSGTLQQTVVYQDGTGGIDGLGGALRVAGRGDLLFVTAQDDDALSTWRVNASSGTLTQIQLYRDGVRGIDGLDGAHSIAVSGDGDLLFVTGGDDDALSVWRVNAEAGTLIQVDLHLDGERGIDGLDGAHGIAVSGDLLFVAGSADNAVSAWRIKGVEVSLDMDTVLSVQSDMPILEDVVVTVTASNGAEMFAKTVSLSAGILSEEVIFPAGTLGPGRWIFTAQAEPPALLNTGAARIAVQVFPLLSLESRQEQFAVGSSVTLTVRATAGVSVDTTYRITVLNRASPQTISSITVMHPAGSTEVTVLIPSQSLFAGQSEISILLPPDSPFRADSNADSNVVISISAPVLSMQPSGVLTMMEHAVRTGVYFNGRESNGLDGAADIAVSGELLIVTAETENALSVWRVNAEAGTLSQTAIYQDSSVRMGSSNYIAEVDGRVDGLFGASNVAVSGDGALLFVTSNQDDALSVWRVNAEVGTLSQTVVYRNNLPDPDDASKTINGLDGARGMVVSGDGTLLFVTASFDDALSVWRVNAEAGTLSQTALYRNNQVFAGGNTIRGLDGASNVAVSDNLLFVTASSDGALSVWRVNAEAGTLSQIVVYRDGDLDDADRTIGGLFGVGNATVSSDGALLFVTATASDALSVWRVNAEAGTLSQTALYQDSSVDAVFEIAEVDGRVDGLSQASEVAVSGDLLFVTARDSSNSALSVWRVNAEAGTLSQTALYRDDDPGIGGLLGAIGAAVSDDGDLLFVTAQFADALSVWHINNAEVPFGAPVMIRVQSDMPVLREVVVTITARNGAEEAEAAVTLSPDGRSAEAIFHLLSPGRWIFTAQAQPPALLNTGAAGIAMQVRAPVELTLDVPGDVTVGNTFTVTVGVPAETPLPKSVSVTATLSLSAGDGAEIEVKEVVLTGEQSAVTVPFTVPSTAGRYTVAARGIRSDSILLPVIGTSAQVTVQPVLALDVPSAPIYRGVMFPVRVRLLGGLLEDNGSVAVTVYLRNAVTHALASTATATLSTAAPSDELSFEAIPGEAAVTAYSLTTEDIDQAGLAPLTRAVLSLQSAPPATVFINRINADLSGNRAFDVDDAVLIVRGLLTKNYLARSAGGLSPLGPGALQARLSELAGFADISGDGGLDIIDMILVTRNPDATVSDLQSRVNADDNPFAYLCGDSGSDACEDISSPHQNITEGIRYEVIGEVLDGLRRVPQPPILLPPNNP